jgi:AraC family transcriptional regulator
MRNLVLEPDAKMELHQRHPDGGHPFSFKRMSWSWFSAELVRIQPTTELEFRVKGDAAYLALHDYVRSDGETTINGGNRSTLNRPAILQRNQSGEMTAGCLRG